jgi:L-aminopeptidase/D-esterase-like protein
MFKIGHYTDKKNITGCTVILMPENTVGSCYIAGSSPGTREIALLSPERKITSINAVLLTGGSAFGLNATQGVVQYLEEQNIGYFTKYGLVPIVPSAVIFDLNIGNSKIRPLAENAYQTCVSAKINNDEQGNVGAGTGATVGKWSGIDNAMKAGLGIAELKTNDVWVKAISVVNAVGDIVNERGEIIAGAQTKDGKYIAQDNPNIRFQPPEVGFSENTVLIVILTNAKIDKLQSYIISKKAFNGMARAIVPANTNYDGDIIFTFSNQQSELLFDIVIEMATEAVRLSILNAVKHSDTLGGFPGMKSS